MKVKVGTTVYDGKDEPVMVILSPEDKTNIADMAQDATRYCSYPDGSDPADILRWMNAPILAIGSPPIDDVDAAGPAQTQKHAPGPTSFEESER